MGGFRETNSHDTARIALTERLHLYTAHTSIPRICRVSTTSHRPEMASPSVSVTPASPDPGAAGVHNRRGSYQTASGISQRAGAGAGAGAAPSYPSAPVYASHLRSGSAPYVPDVSGSRPSNPDAPLEKLRKYTSQAEDLLDQNFRWIKPHLPALGRFLIVVTFLEDALRIVTQWDDQLYYLQRHRRFPWGISHIFLLVNVLTMLACSALVIAKRYPEPSIAGLLLVVVAQGVGYGLFFDLNFFLRNLSVIGGLLMVLSDSLAKRKSPIFAGLPNVLSETDRRKYFQLAGRVLLIFLFIGFVLNGKFTFFRAMVSLLGLGACIMVVAGFKAKASASFLVLLLSVFNLAVNNWWSVHSAHPQRDFLKYDFFQTLSIVGGLLLLVNLGPGGISVDEGKKLY